jgi:NADH dehydrogenase/NADH:ubiquinone oxidoreductase subunit G
MKITIDGKEIKISDNDKNIVDVADREKISIPAPCYRANRKKGCCNACVIEVNGEKIYACSTKPLDGMNIIFARDDLKELRRERLTKYQEAIKDSGKGCECDCSGEVNTCS